MNRLDNSPNSIANLADYRPEVDRLRVMLMHSYDCTGHGVHDEILRFAFQLEQRYSDVKQCMLYLLIIGGTLPERCGRFDYVGADSIADFIRQLYRECQCRETTKSPIGLASALS